MVWRPYKPVTSKMSAAFMVIIAICKETAKYGRLLPGASPHTFVWGEKVNLKAFSFYTFKDLRKYY